MDAVPGRLNQVSLYINRPGVYYGQCSELCGVNHSFMPIAVEAVSVEDYLGRVFAVRTDPIAIPPISDLVLPAREPAPYKPPG